MRSRLLSLNCATLFTLLAVFVLGVAGLLPAYAEQARFVDGELLVRLRADVNEAAAERQVAATVGRISRRLDRIRGLQLKLNPGVGVAAAIGRLNRSGLVEFAEPNYIRTAVTTNPNDPGWGSQYGPAITRCTGNAATNFVGAWDLWQPSGQVILAIVDTGVDGAHPDLTNKMLRNPDGSVKGYDATTGTWNGAIDGYGHGTHVAGIAAAESNNGIGIAGIAGWNPTIANSGRNFIKILSCRVLDSTGNGSDAWVADGIIKATDAGASVINMSLGGPDFSTTLQDACAYAWNHGTLVVAAAGNSGVNSLFYPAAYPNVISVAATDSGDVMATWSNFGAWVTMAAPGVSVYATLPTYANAFGVKNYGFLSGTSMACPHVAGAAALLKAHNQPASNLQIRNALANNTDPYDGIGRSPASINGRLNVYKAMVALGPGNAGLPAQVTGLTAGAGNTQVNLAWSAANGASTYNVKRSTTPGGPYALITSGITPTNYPDAGLANGTTYYYVVSASNASGEGPNSAEVSSKPNSDIRINAGGPNYNAANGTLFAADNYFVGGAAYTFSPRPITNTSDPDIYLTCRYGADFSYSLPAGAGNYTVKLHFAEGVFTATGKRFFNVDVNGVRQLSAFDVVAAAGGSNRTLIVTIPASAANGSVTVRFTTAMPGRPAAFVNGLELQTASPPAPSGVVATPGDRQVALTWSQTPGATTYTVKRATVSGGPYVIAGANLSTTAYTDSNLTNGTTYYYVVSASNVAGEGPNSAEVSATPNTGIHINAGGPNYNAVNGTLFAADNYFVGGAAYTFSPRPITNTSDPDIYLTCRYGADFSYSLPAGAGNYTVKLHFAEGVFTATGKRFFNVDVNGVRQLSAFDVVAAAGGSNRALIVTIPASAANGSVTVRFTTAMPGRPAAFVNGLELLRAP